MAHDATLSLVDGANQSAGETLPPVRPSIRMIVSRSGKRCPLMYRCMVTWDTQREAAKAASVISFARRYCARVMLAIIPNWYLVASKKYHSGF